MFITFILNQYEKNVKTYNGTSRGDKGKTSSRSAAERELVSNDENDDYAFRFWMAAANVNLL